MSFEILNNEKTTFGVIKKRSSKLPKIDIFLKGLTHGFNPKIAIFPTFFLRQYRLGKCLLWYSRTTMKKRLSKKLKNLGKMAFLRPKPWVNPFGKI